MKKFTIIAAAVIVLLGAYFIGTGFRKCPTAYISDYAVSADGTEMTLKLFSSGSVGYIRKISVHQLVGGKLYLDCWYAFGGLNGFLGAKDEFTVPLATDTEMLAFFRNPDCYEEVLRKDSAGDWQRVH